MRGVPRSCHSTRHCRGWRPCLPGLVTEMMDAQHLGDLVAFTALSDGTPVYFPPEVANQVTRAVTVGRRVRVTGSPRTGPTGNRLMDAQVITNRQTSVSVTVSNQAFPPAP